MSDFADAIVGGYPLQNNDYGVPQYVYQTGPSHEQVARENMERECRYLYRDVLLDLIRSGFEMPEAIEGAKKAVEAFKGL